MNKANVSKLVRQARKSLGLNGPSQQDLIRAARKALGVTTAQLAQAIGKSENTVNAWLQREGTAKYRNMPVDTRLLLERIVKEHRAAKRRK